MSIGTLGAARSEPTASIRLSSWSRLSEMVTSETGNASSPSSTQKPLAPSPYLLTVREMQELWGTTSEPWYVPEEGETNPRIDNPVRVEWPPAVRSEERIRREEAARRVLTADPTAPDHAADLEVEDRETLARWDRHGAAP